MILELVGMTAGVVGRGIELEGPAERVEGVVADPVICAAVVLDALRDIDGVPQI